MSMLFQLLLLILHIRSNCFAFLHLFQMISCGLQLRAPFDQLTKEIRFRFRLWTSATNQHVRFR